MIVKKNKVYHFINVFYDYRSKKEHACVYIITKLDFPVSSFIHTDILRHTDCNFLR